MKGGKRIMNWDIMCEEHGRKELRRKLRKEKLILKTLC